MPPDLRPVRVIWLRSATFWPSLKCPTVLRPDLAPGDPTRLLGVTFLLSDRASPLEDMKVPPELSPVRVIARKSLTV